MSMMAAMKQDRLREELQADTSSAFSGKDAKDYGMLKDAVGSFLDGVRNGTERLQRIQRELADDTDHTDDWKKKRLETVSAEVRAAQEGLVDDAERYAGNLTKSLKARLEARPLADSPAGTEARLSNARADARMMLENVNKFDLIGRMADLADSDDAALSHLLLATSWPRHYLTARGAPGMASDWERAKAPLLSRAYDDAAVKAAAGLRHLERFASIGDDLRFILESRQAPRV